MREKFYVFLDIDGTLWDMKDLHKRNKVVVELNPESIQAVYALVDSLEQKYDAELVITSRRRTDWCECLRFLQQEGFDIFKYDLHRTHLINWKKPRGVKIAEYMYNDRIGNSGYEPKLFSRLFEKHMAKKENQKMKNNFVVIDDDMAPLKDYILPENIIQTSREKRSLDMEMVEEFLRSKGLENVNKGQHILHRQEEKQVVETRKPDKIKQTASSLEESELGEE